MDLNFLHPNLKNIADSGYLYFVCFGQGVWKEFKIKNRKSQIVVLNYQENLMSPVTQIQPLDVPTAIAQRQILKQDKANKSAIVCVNENSPITLHPELLTAN
ncbi:hypothetical protein VF04_38170, partial [Nostoc linckia z7]